MPKYRDQYRWENNNERKNAVFEINEKQRNQRSTQIPKRTKCHNRKSISEYTQEIISKKNKNHENEQQTSYELNQRIVPTELCLAVSTFASQKKEGEEGNEIKRRQSSFARFTIRSAFCDTFFTWNPLNNHTKKTPNSRTEDKNRHEIKEFHKNNYG